MSAADTVIEPCQGPAASYHEAKHEVFLRMYEDQMQYNALMNRKEQTKDLSINRPLAV
jgi:hypothetical protein